MKWKDLMIEYNRLYKNGDYSQAAKVAINALEKAKSSFESDSINIGLAANSLAMVYRIQRKRMQSEFLFKEALTIFEKNFGQFDPRVAALLQNLGGLYTEQVRYNEAEPLLLRALAIYENTDHSGVVMSMDNLARLHRVQGKLNEAEDLYKRALKIAEKSVGDNSYKVYIILNDYALICMDRKRYSQAESLYNRSLAIGKQIFGENHPDVEIISRNLAELYKMKGRSS